LCERSVKAGYVIRRQKIVGDEERLEPDNVQAIAIWRERSTQQKTLCRNGSGDKDRDGVSEEWSAENTEHNAQKKDRFEGCGHESKLMRN
jgi:hypothetical protein